MQKEKRFQPMGNEKMLLRMAAHSNIPGHVFIRIFSHDPQVIHQGIISLRVINIFLPLIGFQAIGATTYQALGRGLAGFVLSLARQVLFFTCGIVFQVNIQLKRHIPVIPRWPTWEPRWSLHYGCVTHSNNSMES